MKHDNRQAGIILGVAMVLAAGCVSREQAPVGLMVEPCVRVAQAQWQPMHGHAAVTATTVAGRSAVRLPCIFSGPAIERASWDVPVTLDLSASRGLRFNMFCPASAPIANFTLYMRSGKGWYRAEFFPETTNAWCSITINKADAQQEGTPAGWGKIDLLRISAWRGQDVDTEFLLSDIFATEEPGGKPLVAILRGDSAARHGTDEAKSVQQYAEGCAQALGVNGVAYRMLSDRDCNVETLRPFQLVILPYNPDLSDGVADELIRFVGRGGKLLAFYTFPAKLYPVLGVQGGQHVKAPQPGTFAAMHFVPAALPGAPETVVQNSWNITAFTPVPGVSRVMAEWLDDQRQPSGYPAVLGSSNAIVMTHVLLPDDILHKQRMLLAMANRLVPEIGRRVAAEALEKIGQDLDGRTFEEAIREILRRGSTDRRVKPAVAAARSARRAVEQALSARRHVEVPDLVAMADRRLLEAWCLSHPPTPARFRAFWCHNAFGIEGIEWDEAIRRLAENGFTAILPNMLWGGAAFYDSKVLPVAVEAVERGDQIAACLAACRRYGVQLHVWKVNWNLGFAVPDTFVDQMRRAGRLQAGPKGEELLWLCPSHPANRQLEIDAMVEVARKYPVDGIHFDYIRYPDNNHCFCAGCRERFEHALGAPVQHWPADVRAAGPLVGPWLEWRRSNISAVVQAVSTQARAVRPGIRISAAVFRDWSTDRDSVGQDWKLWCDKGWVDFVCPMDYTPNNQRFEGMVARQVAWSGRTPCYPGIGVSASSSHFGAARTIEQIDITQRFDTAGFVIFNYGITESRDLLPLLGIGITRPAALHAP